jgi:hypothetical protein
MLNITWNYLVIQREPLLVQNKAKSYTKQLGMGTLTWQFLNYHGEKSRAFPRLINAGIPRVMTKNLPTNLKACTVG